MDEYIAMIKLFAGNFAPRSMATCSGQILSIAQNTALFSLIGTYYGGNGQTTFGLPDLRGRVPIGVGQGAGLSNYNMGQASGTESMTLTRQNMPAHSHPLTVSSAIPDSATPVNTILTVSPKVGSGPNASQLKTYSTAVASTDKMAMNAIGVDGGNQPFSIMQPCLAMTYCIVLQGIFPSRD